MKEKTKKDKFEMKFYVVKFEDGSYLNLNFEAEEEKDTFHSTVNLSEATFLNKELRIKMEYILEEHNDYLYIEEAREFKKVIDIESYGLFKLA